MHIRLLGTLCTWMKKYCPDIFCGKSSAGNSRTKTFWNFTKGETAALTTLAGSAPSFLVFGLVIVWGVEKKNTFLSEK